MLETLLNLVKCIAGEDFEDVAPDELGDKAGDAQNPQCEEYTDEPYFPSCRDKN